MWITIGKQTINEEIFIDKQQIIHIIRKLLSLGSLFFSHNKYEIAHEDSPRNNGLPIVLHWRNTGELKKTNKESLFIFYPI